MPRTFGLVPAAGKSVRMGTPKLLLPWQGKPILAHVVSALRDGDVDATLIVVRPGDTVLRDAARDAGAYVLELPSDTPEMKATIFAGLEEIERRCSPAANDGFLLVPADHPTLDGKLVSAMLQQAGSGASILVPTFQGKRGHPTWIRWDHVARLHELPADEGLNAYLRRHSNEVREIAWHSDEILRDLDTPEDYARLKMHPPAAE